MKSIAAAVTWPAWSWIKRPELRFLFSSYAASLSIRDSVKCRRLIESPLYQEWWGERFKMTGDQNTKIRFDNDKQGYRISTSVDGANTGEGGDIICIDDPHNVKEIESAVKRLSVLDWWDGVMSTRLNDMTEGAYVIIAQRSHHNDLIGHILKQEDWVHLNLPAEYEPSVKCQTCISWEDPRKEEGELLWPAKFSKVDIETLKTKLGSYRAAAQLQQRPSPKGGGIIQIDWFNYLEVIPFTLAKIQSWDTAFKEKTMNDYSVCETWLRIEAGYMLIDIWRGKVGYPELKRMAIALYDRDKPNAIIIEDAASGQSLIQDFKKTPMPVLARTPDKDKISRASTVAPTIEAGKVFLLAGQPWLADFLDEIQQFPTGEYKDQVDALSQALNYLIAGGLYTGPIAMGESVASKGDDL
jgi:predicted phage terminase large subunit-like protein